jgi:hypothetical protein
MAIIFLVITENFLVKFCRKLFQNLLKLLNYLRIFETEIVLNTVLWRKRPKTMSPVIT